MLQHKTFKQFLALAMLVVFAFSITPQKSIHDLVAKHIDPNSCKVHKDLPIEQIEKQNCIVHLIFKLRPHLLWTMILVLKLQRLLLQKRVIYILLQHQLRNMRLFLTHEVPLLLFVRKVIDRFIS